MFDKWRKRRQLNIRIAELEEKRRARENERQNIRDEYLDAERRSDSDDIDLYDHVYQEKCREISWLETEQLKNEGRKYDIVFARSNKNWWWSDPNFEGNPTDAPDMLTEEGKAGAIKQIKDERRAEFDSRIKTLSLIITLIIGLIGASTGLVSVYYSVTKATADTQCQNSNVTGDR